ncbi:HAD-IIB family hydrolase [Candidatus Soleaferrea massiliensis]|uniref:HAD-IIB family hydrolase n=1 Tax=Candidatus Soleaferrea massiliensis TaxID=1470354 RepID=UPI00058E5559|nr:HAD-IIB family hydrolase [Candidatus Soleaferrea massiliensis]
MIQSLSDILLITDMDGTLMSKSTGILPCNLQAIERFVRKGGRFTVATGRAPLAARCYLEKLPINEPLVMFNGGAIYDYNKKEFLWNAVLPGQALRYGQEILDAFPEIGSEIVLGDSFHIVRQNAYIEELLAIEYVEEAHITRGGVDRGGFKMLFAGESRQIELLREFVKEKGYDGVDFVQSDPNYYEMLPQGHTKGTSLQKLTAMLGIPMEHTAAIGDYYNDEDMLRKAGIGAVVGGAPKELLAAADFIARPFDEGAVASLIEHLEALYPM